MIIREKFRPVVVGVLLIVVCGRAVAEEGNITTPAENLADEVGVTSTEQPEQAGLTVSNIDKLQLELAREISVGEQAAKLKALADSFADLPPDAVKALLEHGGESGRLQRAVDALHAWRSAETNPKLTADAFVEEQGRGSAETNPKLTADAFVEEQGSGSAETNPKLTADAFVEEQGNGSAETNPKLTADAFVEEQGSGSAETNPKLTADAFVEEQGGGSAETNPKLTADAFVEEQGSGSAETNPKLTADAFVEEQGSGSTETNPKLTADAFVEEQGSGSAETNPKWTTDAFVEEQGRGSAETNPKWTTDVFVEEQGWGSAETNPKWTTDVFVEEQQRTETYAEGSLPEPEPEPEPTVDIVYIEVPKADRSGRVIIKIEDVFHSVTVGESFVIRQVQYKVIAIRYLSPSEIEFRLETEGRTINLIKKI